MKTKVLCCILLYWLANMAASIDHNGQPGCKTDAEIQVKFYRNIWDPTAYWRCFAKGKPAAAARCPSEKAFDDNMKACVPWDVWEWAEPVEPPSRPDFPMNSTSNAGTVKAEPASTAKVNAVASHNTAGVPIGIPATGHPGRKTHLLPKKKRGRSIAYRKRNRKLHPKIRRVIT